MTDLYKRWGNTECEILKGYSEGELSWRRKEGYQDWIAEIECWKSVN